MNENVILLPVRKRSKRRLISTAAFAKEPPEEFLDRLEHLLFDVHDGIAPLAEVINFGSFQDSAHTAVSDSSIA